MAVDEMVSVYQKEAAYWKSVAIFLADCHAATAQTDALVKRTPLSELRRQRSIVTKAAAFLREQDTPSSWQSGLEWVAERCDRAAEACEKRLSPTWGDSRNG